MISLREKSINKIECSLTAIIRLRQPELTCAKLVSVFQVLIING